MADSCDDVYGSVVEVVAARLGELGFKRSGSRLRRIERGNSALIEFQKSGKSDRSHILFTVNVAVVIGSLLEEGAPPLTRAGAIYGHYVRRIGDLLPENRERWWSVTGSTDAAGLGEEVAKAVQDYAVPQLETYIDTAALKALWDGGSSPGLTDVQRRRYLDRLERGTEIAN